uniref:Uncharacterized protein n=1 Tax=Micrurus carvalhoi TaxID=3147026 RepID=A0A2H6MXE6_9SAUR
MEGLLTCHQCSKHMESLKDHTFWDFHRTWVRRYLWFILVIVIVLTLWIIPYTQAPPELGRNCPKDQAKGLHNISQLEEEKVALGKQLTKKEKEMQKLRKFMNQSQEKTLQLLEKKQEEADALIKESTGFNQTLLLTRQFLEKEKEKTQSLQSQLKTLEEQLKSANSKANSKAEEYKGKIAELQRQIKEQEQRNQDSERGMHYSIMELHNQIRSQEKKCSIGNILGDGTIVAWAFGILLLFICCVKCCRQE